MGNVYIFTCPKCGTPYTGDDLATVLADAARCCANKPDDDEDED
jgi:hypothetical protein